MGQFLIYSIIFACGWLANHYMFKYHMIEHPEKMQDMIEELKEIKKINDQNKFNAKEPDVIARVEYHGTLTYLFNKESGQFLGQGLTVDEALEKAAVRFPDSKFLVE